VLRAFRLPACIVLGLLAALVATAGRAAGTERASVDSAGARAETTAST
jgi:hypothetical protein